MKRRKRSPSAFDGKNYRGHRVSVRLVRENPKYEPIVVEGPQDVFKFMKALQDSDRERLYALHVNPDNTIIGCEEVGVGTATYAITTAREVFKAAILSSATGVIMVHNHPCGDPRPSDRDKELTRSLYRAGELLGIELYDHLIVGHGKFYSFRQQGLPWPPK